MAKEKVDKKTGEIYEDAIAEHMRGMCSYNERGEEILDPTPIALPVGFTRPRSLQDTMKKLVQDELIRRDLQAHEIETFEEADDFDVEEQDPLESTPYEDCFEPAIPGLAAREQEIRAGAVQDRTPEQKQKARELAKKADEALKAKFALRNKQKQAKKQSDSDDEEDENDSKA